MIPCPDCHPGDHDSCLRIIRQWINPRAEECCCATRAAEKVRPLRILR